MYQRPRSRRRIHLQFLRRAEPAASMLAAKIDGAIAAGAK